MIQTIEENVDTARAESSIESEGVKNKEVKSKKHRKTKSTSRDVRITVTLSLDDYNELDEYCEKNNTDFSKFIREGIELQKKSGAVFTKSIVESKTEQIQVRVSKEEREQLKKIAKKQMGITLNAYLEGCIVLRYAV